VVDLDSPTLNCNVNGNKPVPGFVEVSAGDSLEWKWYYINPYNPSDMIIAAEHRGPIIIYITNYTDGQPQGAVWTKIDHEGYDPVTDRFAVDNLIANRGWKAIKLPMLADGKYILRQEIIALHSAHNQGGAQLYPNCIQIKVVGGKGSAVPNQNFDLNKGYTSDHPGLWFNLWQPFNNYTIPGPEVWKGVVVASNGTTNSTTNLTNNTGTGFANSTMATGETRTERSFMTLTASHSDTGVPAKSDTVAVSWTTSAAVVGSPISVTTTFSSFTTTPVPTNSTGAYLYRYK
jgi:cellulase